MQQIYNTAGRSGSVGVTSVVTLYAKKQITFHFAAEKWCIDL
jgi:hypothetical protein